MCADSRIAQRAWMREIRRMKISILAALFATAISLQAQVGTSPRTLTKRIAPQLPPQRPAYVPPPASGAAPAATAASKAPLGAKEVEQQKLILAAEEKKKLQWQMGRAEKGSDPAQFALGMRYLKGD